MLIPKHYRKRLRTLGHNHLFWHPIANWAYGERYKFKNGVVAYLLDGEIVTLRRGANVMWKLNAEHCVCCGAIIPEGRQVCPDCEKGAKDG